MNAGTARLPSRPITVTSARSAPWLPIDAAGAAASSGDATIGTSKRAANSAADTASAPPGPLARPSAALSPASGRTGVVRERVGVAGIENAATSHRATQPVAPSVAFDACRRPIADAAWIGLDSTELDSTGLGSTELDSTGLAST